MGGSTDPNAAQAGNGVPMEARLREWLKNAKIAYWLIVGGLAFFAVVIALGMVEILSTQQILLLGQVYVFVLIAGMLLQMIARRL
jgi:polyferredoxin